MKYNYSSSSVMKGRVAALAALGNYLLLTAAGRLERQL